MTDRKDAQPPQPPQPPQTPQVQQVQPLPGLATPGTVVPYAPYAPYGPYGYDPLYGGGPLYYDPYYGMYRRRYGYSYQSDTDGLWFCIGITAFIVLFWTVIVALAQAEEDRTKKML